MSNPSEQIAAWLSESRSAAVFTGAGVSTESGVPDFRSPNGVWAKTQPVYFQDFVASLDARREYWRQKVESHGQFIDAQPNIAHRAIAEWELSGRIRGVITQNIDGLHQLAGSVRVLELHGSARRAGCLDCGADYGADEMVEQFRRTNEPPACQVCGGMVKHATISFGQPLPDRVLQDSIAWCRRVDLFLVFGSSLVVHPAAGLPALAKQSGAKLVIVNREPTPLDYMANLVVHAPIGEKVQAIQQALPSS